MKNSPSNAVIHAQNVQLTEDSARVCRPNAGPAKVEPRIELIREGDMVRAIEIICSCGERIRVRCDYE